MKRLVFVAMLVSAAIAMAFAQGVRHAPAPAEVMAVDAGGVRVFVSILPQKTFVERVGGDRVTVEVMVPPGGSPANYELTPQQVLDLGSADVFFTIGVPFERAFIPVIEANVPGLRVVATDANVEKRFFDPEAATRPDPHVWMDPILVIEQAAVMRDTLIELDPASETEYRAGYAAFEAELRELDAELRDALAPVSGGSLFVFHPAYGYFLDRYDIEQVAIEVAGREPAPAELEAIVERAIGEGARVIFVQMEFAQSSATAIAEAIGGSVVMVAPLAPDYVNNIRSIADQVREGLQR